MHTRSRPKNIIIFLFFIQFAVCLPRNVTNSIFKSPYAGCVLGEFPTTNDPIDVTDRTFKEFHKMSDFGVPENTECRQGVMIGLKYINVTKTDTSIKLEPKNMDELEELADIGTTLNLCINIHLSPDCNRAEERVFLKLRDTNNHNPEIIDENGAITKTFEYKVPMPLPANINLYDFGNKIFAKDIDFSNENVEVSITGDDLEFSYVGRNPEKNSKVYATKLRVLKSLSFPVKEYTITVKDSGTPPLETTGTIKVIRDEDASVTNPQFVKAFYNAEYDGENLKVFENIVLMDGKDADVTILEEGYQDYFKPIPKPTNIKATINLEIVKKHFDNNKYQSLTITLTANGKNQLQPAKTTIYIEMKNNQIKFDKSYYEGSYDGVLHLDVIKWYNWKNADVKVFPSEYEQFFKAIKNKDTIVVSLEDLEEFKESSIVVTLGAYVEREDIILAETVIKINLKNKEMHFENGYCKGTYNGDVLDIEQIQLLNGENADIKILEKGYKDYFKPIAKPVDGKIILQINKDLFDTIKKQSLTITLIASADNQPQSAKTTIYIEMKNNQPKFEKPYYEGSYKEEALDMEPIKWENWKNADVIIFPKDNRNFVKATKNNDKIDVSLENLDHFEGTSITITLKAFVESKDVFLDETIIKINLENKKIKFAQNLYEGSFDGIDLKIEEEIKLENGDNAKLYILEEAYHTYFEKSNDKGLVHLSSKGLEHLDKISITITLLAYIESKDNAAKTVIKVKLENKQIRFEKNYYAGSYNESTLTIDQIKLLNGEKATLHFAEQGSDKFINATNNKGIIKLSLQNLKDFTNSSIKVTLIAKLGTDSAKTVINIKLENKQLKFMKKYYEGSFDGKKLEIEPIELANGDGAELEILEKGYQIHFDPNYKDGVVELGIKDLDKINEPSITINLVASKKTEEISTQTVIKIILKTKELQFEYNYYEGASDGKTINIEKIKLINGETASLFIEEDDYIYFNKNNNKGEVELSFNGIENYKETFIKITLRANVESSIAKTTVNIKLENNYLRFDKPLYEAHYKNSKLTAPRITLFNADETEFKIVEEAYQMYFEISNSESNVLIETKGNLNEVKESGILITLVARQKNDHKNNAETTINIYLDDKVMNAYFENSLYIGTSDGQSLSIEPIKLIDGNIVTCSIIDKDYETYFNVTIINQKLVEISLNDGENLNHIEKSAITLTLEANVEKQSKPVTTAIQINLTNKKLQFEYSFYEGYYTANNLYLDAINLKNGKSAVVDIIDKEYMKYFKEIINKNGVVKIELNPDENLSTENGSFILLTVVAREENNFAQTAIQIELKDNEIPEPEFEEPYYSANFDGTKLEIDPIILPSGGEVNILEDDYKDFFVINYKDNRAIITLNETQDLNTIKEPSIILTIVATWKRKLVTSKTIIHIKLERNMNAPHFKEMDYEGNFDGKALKIDGSIEIVGGNIDGAKISNKEYEGYFIVDHKDKVVTIGLNKAQDLNLLNKPFIVLTLEANVQGSTAKTTIHIYLDNNIKSVSFENNFYSGKFDGETLEINPIKLIGGTIDSIEILEPEYQFFNIIKGEQGKIQITVIDKEKENLGSINEPYIVITLVATIENQVARTIVLIELNKSTGENSTEDPTKDPTEDSTEASSGSSETSEPIGYIVAVALLSVLLCIVICGAGGYWYFKLRNKSTFKQFDNDSEEGIATTENKAVNFNTLEEPEFDTTVSQRRPTGFVFHPPPPEDDEDYEDEEDNSSSSDDSSSGVSKGKEEESDDSSDTDEPDTSRSLDRRKSVTFIENIDKIEIERSHDDDDDDDKEEKNC